MVSLTVLHRLLKQTDNITELTSSFSKPIKTVHFGQKCRLRDETNTALPRFAIQNVRHNVKMPMTVIPAIQNAISKVVFTCRSRNTNAMTAYTPIVKGSLRIISYHSDHIQCVTLSRTSVLIASLQFGHTIRLDLWVTT